MKKALRFIVRGRVQGVGYRYFTKSLASRIGVNGYVKNLFDGSVEVYAIGSNEQLKNLKKGLLTGPSFSSVDTVVEEELEVDNDCRSFNVRF